jgi:hypothetical protein
MLPVNDRGVVPGLSRGQRRQCGSVSSAARTWAISAPGPQSRMTSMTAGQVSTR